VREGETPQQALARARREYPEAFVRREPEREPESGFGAAFKASVESLKGEAALLGGKLGLKDVEEAQRYQAEQEDKARKIFRPTEKGWLEAPGTKFGELLGGSLPYMVAPVAAGAAAIPLGAAAPIVGTAGAGLASLAQFTGSNLSRQLEAQKERGEEVSLERASGAAAAAAAVPQAALDLVSLKALPLVRNLFRSVGKDITEAEAKRIAEQGFKKTVADYAKTGARTAGIEGLTEAGQQYFERLQAGLSIADPAAREEYVDSFIGGAVLGAGLSPVGRFVERGGEQGLARRKLDEVAQDQRRAELAEKAKLDAEEAEKRKQPEYLTKLQADYAAAKAKDSAYKAEIKALDAQKDDPAALARAKELRAEYKNFQKTELSEIVKDYNKAGGAKFFKQFAEQQRVAGMTPLEYQMEQFGVKFPEQQPEQPRVFTGEDFEPATPRDVVAEYATKQLDLARQQDMGTFTEADYVQYLMQDPDMAKQLVAADAQLPGFNKKQSAAILGGIKLQLQQQARESYAGATDLLKAQRTEPQQEFLQSWQEDMAELDKERDASTFDTKIGTLVQGALKDAPKVAAPEEVGFNRRADAIVDRLDELEDIRNKSAAESQKAFGRGDVKAGQRLAAEREAAQTALNDFEQSGFTPATEAQRTLFGEYELDEKTGEFKQVGGLPEDTGKDTKSFAAVILGLRKQQDRALMDAALAIDDLRAGTVLDTKDKTERAMSSSTVQTLRNQINAQRAAYIDAALKEAAAMYAAKGKAMTNEQGLRYALQMQDVFNEWVTRSMAAPAGDVQEIRVRQPAQMRGAKIVRGAEFEVVDPRPLEERQFGAYQAAVEVLKDQLRGLSRQMRAVPEEGQRVEGEFLQRQYPQTETQRRAELRGETAPTLAGELKRRREYVGDLIDQALRRPDRTNIPIQIVRALERAQAAIQEGRGGRDLLTEVSREGKAGPAPFAAGLLDAAETLATRVLEGRTGKVLPKTKAQEDYDAVVAQRDRLTRLFEAGVDEKGKKLTPTQTTALEDRLTKINKFLASTPRPEIEPVRRAFAPQAVEDMQLLRQINDALRPVEGAAVEGERAERVTPEQKAELEAQGFTFAERVPTRITKRLPDEERPEEVKRERRKKLKEQQALFVGQPGMDVAFETATATQFANSPQVKKARAVVDQANTLQQQLRQKLEASQRSRLESAAARDQLQRQLDDVAAKLSDFEWIKTAYAPLGDGVNWLNARPFLPQPPAVPFREMQNFAQQQKQFAEATTAYMQGLQDRFGQISVDPSMVTAEDQAAAQTALGPAPTEPEALKQYRQNLELYSKHASFARRYNANVVQNVAQLTAIENQKKLMRQYYAGLLEPLTTRKAALEKALKPQAQVLLKQAERLVIDETAALDALKQQVEIHTPELKALVEAQEAKLRAANKQLAEAAAKLPPTEEAEATRQVKEQQDSLRAAFQLAVDKAMAELRAEAQTKMEQDPRFVAAQQRINAGKEAIADLEKDLETKAGGELQAVIAQLRTLFGAKPEGAEGKYRAQVRQAIEREKAKLTAAENELAQLQEEMKFNFDAVAANARAVSDFWFQYELSQRDALIKDLAKRGFEVIDFDTGRIRTAQGAEATAQQELVRQERVRLNKARQAKLEADKISDQRRKDQLLKAPLGFGMPGVRVEGGRITPVGRAVEARQERLAEERKADQIASLQKRLEERNKTIAQTEAVAADIQKVIDGKKTEFDAATTKRQRDKIIKETRPYYDQLRIAQAQVAALREGKPVREQAPATVATTKALTRQKPLRTGAKEAKEAAEVQFVPGGKKVGKAKRAMRVLYQAEAPEVADLSGFSFGDKDIYYSRGATPNPSTAEGVRTELGKVFPNLGRVQIYDSVDALIAANPEYEGRIPSDARGFVDPAGNKAFLIAENIDKGRALGVLLHEVGAHIGLRNMLGEAQYNALVKAVESWEKRNDGSIESRVAQAARRRVESADTPASQVNDELLAYAIEEAVDAGVKPFETKGVIGQWLSRIASLFQKALQKFGLAPKEITAAELVDMAFGAAKKEMAGAAPAPKVAAAPAEAGELFFSKAPAYSAGLADAGLTADKMISQSPSTYAKFKQSMLGLGFRTRFLDALAPLEKVSGMVGDAVKGMQMMYYLRMYGMRMNFTSLSLSEGVPQLVEKKRRDGGTEWIIESVPGMNIKQIVERLSQKDVIKAAGSADAANRLFTLYLAKLRADNKGYDKLNFGRAAAEAELKEIEAELASGKLSADDKARVKQREAHLRKTIDSLPTEADIKSAFAKIEADPTLKEAFADAREMYNEYNQDLLRFMVQTGAMSKEEADRLLKEKDYIPYYRVRNGVAELMIGGLTPVRIGNLKDSPHLQELVGGEEPIFNFLDSSVQNTSMLVDMAMRNIAVKNAMWEMASVGLAKIRKAGKRGAPQGAVEFKIDGEDWFAIVDTDHIGIPSELLTKGLAGIPTMFPQAIELMGIPARFLRRAITASPVYAGRQLFRDSLSSYMASGSNAPPVLGALQQIGKASSVDRRGITGGQVFTGTSEDKARLLREMQEGRPGWAKAFSKLEAMSMEADAATRRAQYESYINQGLSEMEATFMALESMNFARRGIDPSVQFFTTLIPFMNAQIQSLDVLYRSLRGQMPMNERLQIKEKLIARGMMLAGMSMAYAMAMQDDETYKNARPDEKYNNWFVPIPGMDEKLRVPIPFELGYIFKALPEALINSIYAERGADEAVDAAKGILRNMIPGGGNYGIPAAFKPLIEVGLGKSFFTGRDLESAAEQMQEPWARYRENTSETAKLLGRLFNISPIKIETLVSGYTGSLGMALMQVPNVVLPTPETDLPEKRMSQMPLVGTLFQPKDAAGIIDDTFERLKDYTAAKETYEGLVEKGELAKADAYLRNNIDKIQLASLSGAFRQQIGEITKAERQVRGSSLTSQEKRDLLDDLRQAKILVASSVRDSLGRIEAQ
jgi:hypothetical protein